MRDHLPAFLAHVEAQRSPLTAKTYGRVVVALSDFLGGKTEVPSVAVLESFLARPRSHGGRAAPATRNREIATLRVFFSWGERDLGWPENPAAQLHFEPEPEREPAVLDVAEEHRMFIASDQEPDRFLRERSIAILGFLTQLSLRVGELHRLNLGQLDLDGRMLHSVVRKGGGEQSFTLSAKLCDLVRPWLPVRSLFALPGEDALFVGKHGGRMSVRAVERLVAKIAIDAGILRRVYPHLLRHSGLTDLAEKKVDFDAISRHAGHHRLDTTQRYVRLAARRSAAVVEARSVAIPDEVVRRRRSIASDLIAQVCEGACLSVDREKTAEKSVDEEQSFSDAEAA